ncbi:MAG: glycerate kinase, partial [Chloroflexota bacterium]|nr:glycerate kinase [Chloroflexota bacterium]
MRKIIVATDSFKGSLLACEACGVIAKQAQIVFPDAEILQMPISDGGEGLVEIILEAIGGERKPIRTTDPLGREITAEYLRLSNGAALIEMAGAGGLTLLKPDEYDPMHASTFGVGRMIRDAILAGADPIYIGLGGSATVDGGTGAASALGMRFLDSAGQAVTSGGGLARITRIDNRKLPELKQFGKLVFLTDVTNPLCGPEGAAEIFGPQKGASPAQVRQLSQGLESLGR